MGCLRLVGSLKLYVSFAEYHLLYRALLHKRPTISRSLLIVATPQQPHSLPSPPFRFTAQAAYTGEYYQG